MTVKPISLSIVVPALNEETALSETIEDICDAMYKNSIDWELILVNDGSTDKTLEIANRLANNEERIKVIQHTRPIGVGSCFKDGIKIATKDAITWLAADGENDPGEIIKYLHLLEDVDIVVPFVSNVAIRSWTRRILSAIYIRIINLSFKTKFTYANGSAISRRRVFEIVKPKSNGFFFQTECLIKATHSGFLFTEVPVHLRKRMGGHSKAITLKSLFTVIREFICLFYEIRILRKTKMNF